MTNFDTVQQFNDTAKELIAEKFAYNAWGSTSLLIQVLNKLDGYLESLNEQHPDEQLFDAQMAVTPVLEMINNSYNVPTDDERFEEVKEVYMAVVGTFIKDVSDEATLDIFFLGGLAKYIAEMRTYSWDQYISETGPSEEKFNALKLAKRDEKMVEIAMANVSEFIMPD
jgi:hypothetical protein